MSLLYIYFNLILHFVKIILIFLNRYNTNYGYSKTILILFIGIQNLSRLILDILQFGWPSNINILLYCQIIQTFQLYKSKRIKRFSS